MIKTINPDVRFGCDVTLGTSVEVRVTDGGLLTIGNNVHISDNVSIIVKSGEVFINDNVFIGRGTVIVSNKKITIGIDTLLAEYCVIRDQDHVYSSSPIRLAGMTTSSIDIGNDCWIGTKVTVTKGSKIGDGSVIGANSVVTKDIPSNKVFAGAPAKLIKDRVL